MKKQFKTLPLYMKLPLLLITFAVIVAVAIQAFALIKCEVLTFMYYNDFEFAYQENTMLGEMEYFKVLSCDKNNAKVYYVSKDCTDGNVLTFVKENDAWKETEWDTIWSATGSASNVIWPYWWQFIYTGF